MSDSKSKMPDLKELGSMGSKLWHGLKSSINDIVRDYKEKRKEPEGSNAADVKRPVVKPTPEIKTPEVKTSGEEMPKDDIKPVAKTKPKDNSSV